MASTGWDSVYISSLSKGNGADLEGKNVEEISESRGSGPADCMMDLLLEQDGKVSMVFFHMAEADVEQVLSWDRSLISTTSRRSFSRTILRPGPLWPPPAWHPGGGRLHSRDQRVKTVNTAGESGSQEPDVKDCRIQSRERSRQNP